MTQKLQNLPFVKSGVKSLAEYVRKGNSWGVSPFHGDPSKLKKVERVLQASYDTAALTHLALPSSQEWGRKVYGPSSSP